MKIETKEIYKCEYCGKWYRRKHFAIKHELMCFKNPKNYRPCISCPNLEKREVDIYEDYYGHKHRITLSLLHCKKKEIYLYPPKVEIKGNAKDFGEINEPMPKTCKIYDDMDLESDWLGFLNQ